MPSWLDVAICATAATLFWTVLGLAVGRRLLPQPLATGFAPALGFALHAALLLPFHAIGLTPVAVWGLAAALAALGLALLARTKVPEGPAMPVWIWPAAALIAALAAAAVMPKAGGTVLAAPILEHTRIAIVDEIARLGVPPGNPFFAAQGPRLPYDYLWHAMAAALAVAAGVNGWTADAALTGVTALASLTAVAGLAAWWRGASAAAWVLALALAGSLRPLIELAVSHRDLDPWFLPPSGPTGWLGQAAALPQHVAAAICVVLAGVLIARLAQAPRPFTTLVLGLVAAAAVQCSTAVGGLTLGLATFAMAIVLLWQMPKRRPAFVLALAAAALIALVLSAPMLLDQFAASAARDLGTPIAIAPTEVFGPAVPITLRRLLDLPGFWLVYLVVELPAIYLTGLWALRRLWRTPQDDDGRHAITATLVTITAAGLLTAWLLVGTAEGSDLGGRALLPPILVLSAASAAGLAGLFPRRTPALGALLLGLPAGAIAIYGYVAGTSPSSAVFARTPALWEQVRAHTPSTARVANNPQFLKEMIIGAAPGGGSANISWALLADRRSCFAGEALVRAVVPLPPAQRRYIENQFVRLFSGEMPPEDVTALLTRYRCDAVVLTAQDGAWERDPFPSAGYRLAASQPSEWRIYVRVDVASRSRGDPVTR